MEPIGLGGLVAFVLGLLLLVEFLFLCHRVAQILRRADRVIEQLEQQNRHLAAISADMVSLINVSRPSARSSPALPE